MGFNLYFLTTNEIEDLLIHLWACYSVKNLLVQFRCQQTFTVNTRLCKSFRFVGEAVLIETIQLCCCSVKAAIDNKEMGDWAVLQ